MSSLYSLCSLEQLFCEEGVGNVATEVGKCLTSCQRFIKAVVGNLKSETKEVLMALAPLTNFLEEEKILILDCEQFLELRQREEEAMAQGRPYNCQVISFYEAEKKRMIILLEIYVAMIDKLEQNVSANAVLIGEFLEQHYKPLVRIVIGKCVLDGNLVLDVHYQPEKFYKATILRAEGSLRCASARLLRRLQQLSRADLILEAILTQQESRQQ